MERNYFRTDDAIRFQYKVDNSSCGEKIQSIAGKLYRNVRLVGREGSRNILQVIAEVHGESIPARGNSGDFRELVLYITDLEKPNIREKRTKKQKKYQPEDLAFANFMQPTTVGSCFSMIYEFRLYPMYGGCSTSNGIKHTITLNPTPE